jgi:hypothetical protein
MDSTRELRAMTMATFPCPPLPMVGANLYGDKAIVNSHDLLSFLINTAARRDMKSENEARVAQQFKLYESYFKSLALGTDLFETMTRFTRDYMMTYTHAMHYLRFLPFDAATPPIKHQVCSWLAAQHILKGVENANAGQFLDLHHDSLYSKCALAVQDVNVGVCADGRGDVQGGVEVVGMAREDSFCHP